MNKFLLFFVPVAFLILFASCNKDQQVVTEMEGDWRVVSEIFNSVPEDPAVYKDKVYTFERCGVKKRDCTGSFVYAGTDVPFTYSVFDDGKRIRINTDYPGVTPVEEGDIIEHSTAKLIFRFEDADGDVLERVLEPED